MAILLIRSVVLYFILLIAMKLMGKRQLGQLQPFELVSYPGDLRDGVNGYAKS